MVKKTVTKIATQPDDEIKSPYDRLEEYIDGQRQRLLKRYSVRQLADSFVDFHFGENSRALADDVLSLGLKYEPSKFELTGLEIALGGGRNEMVFCVGYKQGEEDKSMVLRSELYHDNRKYSVYGAIDDLYSTLMEEIDDMQPEEWSKYREESLHR